MSENSKSAGSAKATVLERWKGLPLSFKAYVGLTGVAVLLIGFWLLARVTGGEGKRAEELPVAKVMAPAQDGNSTKVAANNEATAAEIIGEVDNQRALAKEAEASGSSNLLSPENDPLGQRYEFDESGELKRSSLKDDRKQGLDAAESRGSRLERQRATEQQKAEMQRQQDRVAAESQRLYDLRLSAKSSYMAALGEVANVDPIMRTFVAKPMGDFVVAGTADAGSNGPGGGSGVNSGGLAGFPGLSASPATGNEEQAAPAPIVPGDLVMAVLDTDLNSDEPGPVRATVAAGPLKGAVLLGSFRRGSEAVILEFNTLSFDRFTAGVQAVGIDVETYRTYLATGVDKHILSRYIGLAAAGAGEAVITAFEAAQSSQNDNALVNGPNGQIVQSGNDVEFSDRDLAIAAGGGIGRAFIQVAKSNFARPPTITVAKDELIGIMFLSPARSEFLPDLNPELSRALPNVP